MRATGTSSLGAKIRVQYIVSMKKQSRSGPESSKCGRKDQLQQLMVGGATDRLHKQLYARWDHTHLSGWGVQDNSFLRDQQLRPGKPLTIV